jgi:hypothetical protein
MEPHNISWVGIQTHLFVRARSGAQGRKRRHTRLRLLIERRKESGKVKGELGTDIQEAMHIGSGLIDPIVPERLEELMEIELLVWGERSSAKQLLDSLTEFSGSPDILMKTACLLTAT